VRSGEAAQAGRNVVDIFTPFSHPVITVISVLMRWMAVLGGASAGRGRAVRGGGWRRLRRGRHRGWTGDNPGGRWLEAALLGLVLHESGPGSP